jgi:tetratricopeptide (TPR) repeat protein
LRGRDDQPVAQKETSSRRAAIVALCGGGIVWLGWAAAVFLPISLAEGAAHDADNDAREAHWKQAISEMREASSHVPYNSEYAMRTAKYLLKQPASTGQQAATLEAKKLLDAAVATDPSSMPQLVARAQLELEPQINDPDAAIHDYQRAVTLDPANIRLRAEYANMLKGLAEKTHNSRFADQAKLELLRALDKNEQYHWDEPKRFNPDEVAAVKKSLAELEGPQPPTSRPTQATSPGPRDLGR